MELLWPAEEMGCSGWFQGRDLELRSWQQCSCCSCFGAAAVFSLCFTHGLSEADLCGCFFRGVWMTKPRQCRCDLGWFGFPPLQASHQLEHPVW